MPRKARDYAREYADRKASAIRSGFTGVRAQRNFNRDFTRYEAARNPEARRYGGAGRGPTVRRPTRGGVTPRPGFGAYDPGRFNKAWVMANWDLYGWFDSWAEAREWYDEQP